MRLLLLLGTVLSLGCSGLTDPVVEVASRFEYDWPVGQPLPTEPLNSPTVRRENGTVVVSGIFGLPVPCYTLRVRSAQVSGVLLVAIEAVGDGGPCITVPSSQAYRVRADLPVSVSRVIVQHSFAGRTGSAVVVRDTTLQAQ